MFKLCRLGLHSYQWGEPYTQDVQWIDPNTCYAVGDACTLIVQTGTCTDCGLIKRRKLGGI